MMCWLLVVDVVYDTKNIVYSVLPNGIAPFGNVKYCEEPLKVIYFVEVLYDGATVPVAVFPVPDLSVQLVTLALLSVNTLVSAASNQSCSPAKLLGEK
jgi:hypothetical protein